MQISKRNGTQEGYCPGKIKRAVSLAFTSVGNELDEEEAGRLLIRVERKIQEQIPDRQQISVEEIQDLVEQTLMEENYYKELKSFILYREDRARRRRERQKLAEKFSHMPSLEKVLHEV